MAVVTFRKPNTESGQNLASLSPDHFYHPLSVRQMETWTHWLPAVQVFFRSGKDPSDKLTKMLLIQILNELGAEPEVLEEFDSSWNLGLFTAYEVHTPVSRDASDPLLCGLDLERRFGIAVWGNLLPFHEITALVQQSLDIRRHASRRHPWLLLLSGLGLVGATFLLSLTAFFRLDGFFFYEPSTLAIGLVTVCFVKFCIALTDTPEYQQYTFLDQFR